MRGPRWKTLFVSVLAVAIVACTHAVQHPVIAPTDFIRLERGPCFGACPSYSVTLFGDGGVEYTGERYVRVTGTMHTQVPRDSVVRLFEEAESIGFFQLDSSYIEKHLPNGLTESVTDLPSQIVTLSRGGTIKRVYDYYGSPDELRSFERHIDDVANTAQWVGR